MLDLVELGASVNDIDNSNHTPLLVALENNYLATAASLLSSGADHQVLGKRGQPASHLIVIKAMAHLGWSSWSSYDMKDDNLLCRVLFKAAQQGDVSVVRCLILLGSDINQRDSEGWTPLHWATWNGDVSMARWLLTYHGIDPNAQTVDGDTPLHTAVYTGRERVVDLFVDNNKTISRTSVNINSVNNKGRTPLTIAIADGHVAILRKLKSM